MRNDPESPLREAGMAASLGTAGHALIALILDGHWHGPTDANTLTAWVARAVPAATAEDCADTVAMLQGLLADLPQWVRRVIAVESGFVARFGEYWLAGHVDLIYEPVAAPGTVAICDWKFGANKPHVIELAHGWEAGLYSAALRFGLFEPPLGRDRVALERDLIAAAAADPEFAPTHGVFPSQIHQVHLADYVPYKRAGTKELKRPEDLRLHGYTGPTNHRYQPGDRRGGAWMPIALDERDLQRFAARLRTIVGTVRMGRFIDSPGEKCSRCHYAPACLNAGYDVVDTDTDRAALALLEQAARER